MNGTENLVRQKIKLSIVVLKTKLTYPYKKHYFENITNIKIPLIIAIKIEYIGIPLIRNMQYSY